MGLVNEVPCGGVCGSGVCFGPDCNAERGCPQLDKEAHGPVLGVRPRETEGSAIRVPQPYEEFETAFAGYIGTSDAVSCNTGTAALHLALLALGIGPGDEVICPNFTMAAVPFAVTYCGAKPVFVDCGEDLNINPDLIHAKITYKTRAIIAVHTYGRVCDMDRILSYGLPVIEDCAEAHGATYKGQKVGSIGTIGAFSFYRNKILAAEEGGAITTNNTKIAEVARYFKNMAFDVDHTYDHRHIGYNYRMPNATADVLLGRLPFIDNEIQRRKDVSSTILGYWELPRKEGSVVWVKDVLFDTTEERDAMLRPDTRRFFRPMTTLPMWRNQDEYGLAHDFSERGLYFIV